MAVTRYPSEDKTTSAVATIAKPLEFYFSKRTMSNRLFKASMGETMATWDGADSDASGIPTREIIELYRRWGELENGFGAILTGNIQISLTAPHLQGDLIIDESHPFHGPRFEAWERLAKVSKASGSLIIGQLSYPGRQALDAIVRKTVIAPSVVSFENDAQNATFAKTREATHEDIDFLIRGFVHAARYLEAASFNGIELHGAHGYLLAQFLATRTNRRTDEYGGSLTNRMRLLVEIARQIRAKTSPNFIIGIKLNSVEFQDGGFNADEAAVVTRALQDVRVDFVELSGGTLEKIGHEWTKETTQEREAFFLKFAQTIVPQLGSDATHRRTKVFLTGGLRTIDAMSKALATVDAIGIARPAAQEPWIARDFLAGKVSGVIHPLPPFDNDSALSNGMAGAQLRQIASGLMPFNSSDETALRIFKGEKAAHDIAAANDNGKTLPWFLEISTEKVAYNSSGEF